MADQERIAYLFDKYLGRACTPAEVEELVRLLQDEKAEETLTPRMRELWEQIKAEQQSYLIDWQRIYDQVTQGQDMPGVARRSVGKRILFRAAAAIAAILILSGGWYIWYHGNSAHKVVLQGQIHDALSGSNKAVLTLANGNKVMLDGVANGIIAQQGLTQIVKLDSSELAYQPAGNNGNSSQPIQYNTLATPRGGQYQIRLPDGTKVWLNAASSIRYPAAFTGKERQVVITGEAYFEIAQHASSPFMVTVNNMQVKVLGTHFNINAYTDEASIKTTLLEGSIKVQPAGGNAVVVIPGQQAQIDKAGKIKLVKADVNEAVAWKNGLFVFRSADLTTVMRQLSRWYDIEVAYKDNTVPVYHFTGAIRRQENLPKVFKMLELTGGVHFEIDGRKIIVSP